MVAATHTALAMNRAIGDGGLAGILQWTAGLLGIGFHLYSAHFTRAALFAQADA